MKKISYPVKKVYSDNSFTLEFSDGQLISDRTFNVIRETEGFSQEFLIRQYNLSEKSAKELQEYIKSL